MASAAQYNPQRGDLHPQPANIIDNALRGVSKYYSDQYQQYNARDGMQIAIEDIRRRFEGKQVQVAQEIVRSTEEYSSVLFTICPVQRTNTLATRTAGSYEFLAQLPTQVSPFSPVVYMTRTESSTSWEITCSGIGFRVQLEDLQTERGQQLFEEGYRKMTASFIAGAELDVLATLLRSPVHLRYRDFVLQPPTTTADYILKHSDNMFIFNKNEKGIVQLIQAVHDMQLENGVPQSSIGIVAQGTKYKAIWESQFWTEASRVGTRQAGAIIREGKDALPTIGGVQIYEQRKYNLANRARAGIIDPMARIVELGSSFLSEVDLKPTSSCCTL